MYKRQTLVFSLVLLATGLFFAQQLRKSHRLLAGALTKTEEALSVAEKERASALQAQRQIEQTLQRYELEREYSSALLATREGTAVENAVFLVHNLMMRESVSLPAVENCSPRN